MSLSLPSLTSNVATVIKGKEEVIRLATISLICGGHLLLEDVPGVGKTMLARSVAKSLDVQFQRIQFTPDLLPSDVTGLTIYNQSTKTFEFHRGPVFTNVLLADEINRATPRTQSSLLEAMNEGQVTVDQQSYQLPKPFFVIATQNPTEFQGTYPLPEAQLDRFFMRVALGYPGMSEEMEILRSQREQHPIDDLGAVTSGEAVLAVQKEVRSVHLADDVIDYVVRFAHATRNHEKIRMGVSPRGTLGLMRASQGNAYVEGRDFVTPDDVQAMIIPTLSHRIVLHPQQVGAIAPESLLEELIEMTAVPV